MKLHINSDNYYLLSKMLLGKHKRCLLNYGNVVPANISAKEQNLSENTFRNLMFYEIKLKPILTT